MPPKKVPVDPDAKGKTTADTAYISYLSCKHFANSLCGLNVLSYFFWTGLLYFVGAVVLIAGFQSFAPRVFGSIKCPAKQQIYLMVSLWFIMSIVTLVTSYGYATIKAFGQSTYEHASKYVKVVGFFVKVFPTWMRLVHLLNFFQYNVIMLQFLLLPECNKPELVYILGVSLFFWWGIIGFGIAVHKSVFIPAALYYPLLPTPGIVQDIQSFLKPLGP